MDLLYHLRATFSNSYFLGGGWEGCLLERGLLLNIFSPRRGAYSKGSLI